jgi:hypothetical protein
METSVCVLVVAAAANAQAVTATVIWYDTHKFRRHAITRTHACVRSCSGETYN